MQLPLLQWSHRSAGSKIIWVVCDAFGQESDDGSPTCVLDRAYTPNLDQLCHYAGTGLLKRQSQWCEPSVEMDSFTRSSILEIRSPEARPLLADLLTHAHSEVVSGLWNFELSLLTHWNEYDLFLLKFDWRSEVANIASDLGCKDWIEILDTWLPGLMAFFRPDVFAVSGDFLAPERDGGRASSPIPVLLHSSQTKGGRNGGFTLDSCRNGRLGRELALRDCLFLLMALAND